MNKDHLLRDYHNMGAGYNFGDERFLFSSAPVARLVGSNDAHVYLMAQAIMLGHIVWTCEPSKAISRALADCCQLQTVYPKYLFHRLLVECKRRMLVIGERVFERITVVMTNCHTVDKFNDHLNQIIGFDLSLLKISLFLTSADEIECAYEVDTSSLRFKRSEIGYRVKKYMDVPYAPIEGTLGTSKMVSAKEIARIIGVHYKDVSTFASTYSVPGKYRIGERLIFDPDLFLEFYKSKNLTLNMKD